MIGAALFVAAGSGSIAFSEDASPLTAITDVRIGERGPVTRIAIFCSTPCKPQLRGPSSFNLPGSADAFNLDFSEVSDRVTGFSSSPGIGGALLSFQTSKSVTHAAVSRCSVSSREAMCIDLFFEEAEIGDSSKTTIATAGDEASKITRSDAQSASASMPAAVPGELRETANQRLSVFAELSPPERLQVPTPPILAKVQPIEKTVAVATPTLRAETISRSRVIPNFSDRIRVLLGKQLTTSFCNGAEMALQSDAWALNAMGDVGLCAAARGDFVEAEAILSRLLEYTPDSYEALVGRAVIAEIAGERGAALRYYQDALDSPPPVEESTRIIEAMAALT